MGRAYTTSYQVLRIKSWIYKSARNLYRGRRAVPLQTFTTWYSNRKLSIVMALSTTVTQCAPEDRLCATNSVILNSREHCSRLQQWRCHSVIEVWMMLLRIHHSRDSQMVFNGPCKPQNCPFPVKGISTQSNAWLLVPIISQPRFILFRTAHQYDQHTDTGIQTTLRVTSVATCRILTSYLCTVYM